MTQVDRESHELSIGATARYEFQIAPTTPSVTWTLKVDGVTIEEQRLALRGK